jgi:hypothetical protein
MLLRRKRNLFLQKKNRLMKSRLTKSRLTKNRLTKNRLTKNRLMKTNCRARDRLRVLPCCLCPRMPVRMP